MRDETRRNLRVGMLVAAATAVLAVTILTIGERRQLFIRHTRYFTTFSNVLGLKQGAPVNLDGVTVGFVRSIELGTHPSEQRITVWFAVDVGYTERIRTDTRASIKTIGLLGDKYLEVRSGSPNEDRILEGGMVPGKDPAEVEELMAGGEDLMANLISISSSLKVILERVQAGEGLIGELTSTPNDEEKFSEMAKSTIASLRLILTRLENGEGFLGRLLTDGEMADDLYVTAHTLRLTGATFTRDLQRDDSAYAAMFRDPETATLVRESVSAFRDATQAMAAAFEELSTGEGTLPRLMRDKEYADDFLDDLQELMHHLRSVTQKLDDGDGTLGAFLNDPQLYQDLENVVRGVKNSSVTSWFIRNRRKSGESSQEGEEALTVDPAAQPPASDDPGDAG
jgi:phospholipid/cholesterol/gamma-HCH transport system substrate-binding protein